MATRTVAASFRPLIHLFYVVKLNLTAGPVRSTGKRPDGRAIGRARSFDHLRSGYKSPRIDGPVAPSVPARMVRIQIVSGDAPGLGRRR